MAESVADFGHNVKTRASIFASIELKRMIIPMLRNLLARSDVDALRDRLYTRSARVAVPGDVFRELNALLRGGGITPIRSSSLPQCVRSECEDVSTRIGRVLVYVDDHLHEPLRLDHLAGEAGLSKYHFSRVFREEVGESPWAFVRRARVERAKKLLADGASPAAAAVDSGFFDQSHLTNALKDAEGRTPKQFQEERLHESSRKDRKIFQE